MTGALSCHQDRGGMVLPALDLWLDPTEARKGPERVFVSHAHSDHTARHREVILTDTTARLMRARLSGERTEHRLGWRAATSFAHRGLDWRITLLPAGHILGSAMALVEAEGDSLLFTGDFKLRSGLSAEPCEPVSAGTLIMETTFGRAKYVFPPVDEVMQEVVRFCRETLGKREVPVLLGYSLGKSQEVLLGLERAGLPVAAHPQVARLSEVYRQCGQSLPALALAEPGAVSGRVVVCPPGADLPRLLGADTRVRKAVLTGWALDAGCAYRYGADAAFPLSDHADFNELIEFVRRVAPRRVFTIHGFAADFAATLRDLGFEAHSLSEGEQLTFRLGPTSLPPTPGEAPAPGPASPPEGADSDTGADTTPPASVSFAACARAMEAIQWAADPADKVERLEQLLGQLPASVVPSAVAWLAGGRLVSPEMLRAGACLAMGVTRTEFARHVAQRGDVAGAVAALMDRREPDSPGLTVEAVKAEVDRLTLDTAPSGLVSRLGSLLRRCRGLEARCLVRILGGELRIGLSEARLEEMLVRFIGSPPGSFRRAVALGGGLRVAGELALAGRLAEASIIPFRPLEFMVATSPVPTSPTRDVPQRPVPWGDEPLWVEEWFGGLPCHLHRRGDCCRWFDGSGAGISEGIAGLGDEIASLPGDLVLEGELIRVPPACPRDGPAGRLDLAEPPAEPDLFALEIGTRFVVSDLLWADDQSWIDRPWCQRREELEAIFTVRARQRRRVALAPGRLHFQRPALDQAFAGDRRPGFRGFTVRRLTSLYLPGAEGDIWRMAAPPGIS